MSVETTTTASAGTNFLNYLNAKQFDQSTLVQPFTAKVETKTEIKASVKVTANAEGLDVTIKNTTSVSADGTKKNETKAVVGVGENGAFVSKATTNKGGKTTSAVRAGVQVEAKAQTGAHTYIKVGASFSAGQRQ